MYVKVFPYDISIWIQWDSVKENALPSVDITQPLESQIFWDLYTDWDLYTISSPAS